MAATCAHCGTAELIEGLGLTTTEGYAVRLSWTEEVDTVPARIVHFGKVGQGQQIRRLRAEVCAHCRSISRLYVDDIAGIEKRTPQ